MRHSVVCAPLSLMLLLLVACGGTQGEAEINPNDIVSFDRVDLDVDQVRTETFSVDAKATFGVFGMPITVRIANVILDLDEESIHNCLVLGVELAGAEFNYLADGSDARCYSELGIAPSTPTREDPPKEDDPATDPGPEPEEDAGPSLSTPPLEEPSPGPSDGPTDTPPEFNS